MKKSKFAFFLLLSSINSVYCQPIEEMIDLSFGKSLLEFFKTEKAEKIKEVSRSNFRYQEFLQENGIFCSQSVGTLRSDWLLFLKGTEPTLEELTSFFEQAKQEKATGIIINALSSLEPFAAKYGYVRDQESEAAFRISASSFNLKNSITVFRKPESFCLKHTLKSMEKKISNSNIRNIDFIYLINLDKRPEKWKKSLDQLKPYGIIPNRFSAVHGWELPEQVVNSIALRFMPGMKGERWGVCFYSDGKNLKPKYDFLLDEVYGKPFFAAEMSPGALGCALSHLSVLQDAYDSGYQTIWVLEDDISVQKDPHALSSFIEKLDLEVGKDGWDVLYTDSDVKEEGDGFRDVLHDLSHIWRPDASSVTINNLPKREDVGLDFKRVMSRTRTHSMVIRRSGMKKILDYIKNHKLYLCYDDELAFVTDIKLFNLKEDCVTFSTESAISDTQHNESAKVSSWDHYKLHVIEESKKISGWAYPEMSQKMLEFIYEKKPEVCVEIGSFGGIVTYQIAKTLQFLRKGNLYAIDAWDSQLASEGIKEVSNVELWKSIHMENLYQTFQKMLISEQIEKQAHSIRLDSRKAVSKFNDNSIDFLYIDGNPSSEGSFTDVSLYFSKVKKGGYIWLNSARFSSKHASVAFLMKNCTWLKKESVDDCQSIVFQKKIQ